MELILEASLSEIRIVLADKESVLWSAVELDGRAEIVESLLQKGLQEIQREPKEIKRILVSRGPGSFTGLRVVLAYAQGLAFSSGFLGDGRVKLHLATTFELLALAAEKHGITGRGAIVLPARRGWFYGAEIEINKEDSLPTIHSQQMVSEELLESTLLQWGQWGFLPQKLSELPALQKMANSSDYALTLFNRDELLIDAALGKVDRFPEGDPLLGFAPNYIEKAQAKAPPRPAPALVKVDDSLEKREEVVRKIAELEKKLFEDHWSEKAINALLLRSEVKLIIALDQNRGLVGYTIFQMAGDELEHWRVAVAPEMRRRGVAKLLLQESALQFADHLKEQQMSAGTEWLEVRSNNKAALQLYLSVGFIKEGERKSYYGAGVDGIIMKRPFQVSSFS